VDSSSGLKFFLPSLANKKTISSLRLVQRHHDQPIAGRKYRTVRVISQVFLLANPLKISVSGPHFEPIAGLNVMDVPQPDHLRQMLSMAAQHGFVTAFHIIGLNTAHSA
jgi:hypothetical protein